MATHSLWETYLCVNLNFMPFHPSMLLLVLIPLTGIPFLLAQLLNPTHFSRFGKSGTFSVTPSLLTPSSGGTNIPNWASTTFYPNFCDSTYQSIIIVNLCVSWLEPILLVCGTQTPSTVPGYIGDVYKMCVDWIDNWTEMLQNNSRS